MARNGTLGLLAFLMVCAGLGAVRIFSAQRNAAHWFATVHRPDFALPVGMIAPFWTLLYLMIALAGWLVWREVGFGAIRATLAYGLLIACNLFSALLFFDAQHVGLLLTSASLLTLAVAWNIWELWRVERIAALLLVPHFVWMGFATAVNTMVWQMN